MDFLPRLDISPDINLYDIYLAESIDNREIEMCIRCLKETFRHFHIHKRNYRNTGNIVLRFSHWIGEQNEVVQIEPDADTEVKIIAKMYECYADLVQQRLKI